MEFTESDVYEALGLGEREREDADPAPQEDGTQAGGGREQEAADPAEMEEPETGDGEDEPPESDGDQEGDQEEPGGREQTREERRENAARRRRQERQAEINDAVAQAIQQERQRQETAMKEFFAKAGLKNTVSGKPITTMEEFDAWREEYEAAKLQRELKAGKLTPESLKRAIGEHPAVKKAQELLRQQEERERGAGMEAARKRAEQDLAEIRKLNPDIKEMRDLLTMPKAREFREFVRRGNSFLDAYYLANREELERATAEKARQKALLDTRGKDHLRETRGRGSGAVSVPPEVKAEYLAFNPGATEAEIQAHYNRYMNKR